MENKLYRETFLILERAILQRKFKSKYVVNKTLLLINCAECGQRMAIIECLECLDHFCQVCSDRVHSKSFNKSHKRVALELYPGGQKHETPAPENGKLLMEGPNYQSQEVKPLEGVHWKKFEYFNFPIPASNDLFATLQHHFEHLKKLYIACNYIDSQTGKIDLASVFVDQNYDSLDREHGNFFRSKHVKALGRQMVTSQKETVPDTAIFNDEELFYMNRIAFRGFKRWGIKFWFKKFVDDLEMLQTGPF